MVCVNNISTFFRAKASFLSTRSCKVYYIMDCIINFDTHNQCAKELGKIGMGFFLWLFSGKGMFLGLVGGPKDFWGFLILPRFDHPCHLKSGVCPGASRCDDTSLWFQYSYLSCFKSFVGKNIDIRGYSVL